MRLIEANDLVNGAEGTVTAIVNGNVKELAEVVSVSATIDLNKAEVKTLGHRMTQHKITGGSGTGTMTIHYVTSLFTRLLIEYVKTGKMPVLTIIITNQDPQSGTGKQVVSIGGILIDSADIAKLDLDADVLDQEIPFTFTEADIQEEFKELN